MHLLAKNSAGLNIPCQQCDRTFSSERSLSCHIKVHNDKILKCCFCEQTFNRTDTLFMHTLEHIRCQIVVESMADGETHAIEKHGSNGVAVIKCKNCPESLPSFRKMLFHHTFKHGELKEFADEMTAKQKEFLRTKKNQNRKDKKTTTGGFGDLKIKMEVEESGGFDSTVVSTEDNKDYVDEDEFKSSTESNTEMIGNLSDVIAELFPLTIGDQYQCLHCMMGFTDAILWMTHLGYHDVENPFKCSGCGRMFENRQTFVLHLTYYAHGADVPAQN
ncbi:hypothetical protein GCK72_009989 [Caenorhabditis remanei]|uniref:C2H2-type domain-containing protein n=1 Tax=Caenorhabditis remanei TaxID=31234 RepID=A0A6A5H5D7_CAERE|nr:hypothetical protein GCK72_009989 [Caenorhabditis remanei]KAF1761733.1 hypothetical protein GCK72_009989 [Caenorhabditis remanei]